MGDVDPDTLALNRKEDVEKAGQGTDVHTIVRKRDRQLSSCWVQLPCVCAHLLIETSCGCLLISTSDMEVGCAGGDASSLPPELKSTELKLGHLTNITPVA